MSSPFFLGVDPMKPVKPSFHPLNSCQATPIQQTQDPKIVGTSVLGMKFKDGIILAADNLGPTLNCPY
jgi:20S proteasome alpha/beta subunit